MLVSGSLLLVPKFVPSGLSSVSARRPIWKGIGQELGRTSLGWRFCSDRGFLREGFDRYVVCGLLCDFGLLLDGIVVKRFVFRVLR